MLQKHLDTQNQPDDGLNINECAASTTGYSGADIKLLCKEAAMRPVRRLLTKLDEMEVKDEGKVVDEKKVNDLIKLNPITQEDLNLSIECTNKSSGGSALDKKYDLWAKEFGST